MEHPCPSSSPFDACEHRCNFPPLDGVFDSDCMWSLNSTLEAEADRSVLNDLTLVMGASDFGAEDGELRAKRRETIPPVARRRDIVSSAQPHLFATASDCPAVTPLHVNSARLAIQPQALEMDRWRQLYSPVSSLRSPSAALSEAIVRPKTPCTTSGQRAYVGTMSQTRLDPVRGDLTAYLKDMRIEIASLHGAAIAR